MNLDALVVNQNIDEKDGMLHGQRDYYFATGKSAMTAILKTMKMANRSPHSITRVMDYACGYGRVLRWIMAGFSHAKVIGCDIDAKAVASTQAILGADTRILNIKLDCALDAPVDMIWVGSLFTHLTEEESLRVLRYLRFHLAPGGLATITTHGNLVEARVRSRERTYNLTEIGITKLLRCYDKTGYGFAAYDDEGEYGISIVTTRRMTEIIEAAGFKVIFFEPHGWVKHQDVFGIQRVD